MEQIKKIGDLDQADLCRLVFILLRQLRISRQARGGANDDILTQLRQRRTLPTPHNQSAQTLTRIKG